MRRKERSNVEPRVVFEDAYLMVVDKPAGMVTNTSQTATELTVQGWFAQKFSIFNYQFPMNSRLSNVQKEFYEKQGIVHRLDKDTSGLLILAKTPEAYANLKQQFLQRKVKKTYLALVHGWIESEVGLVSVPIERHPKVWGKFAVGTDLSRTAITEYKRIMNYEIRFMNQAEKLSLLELRPMTGRTHQLRVHMKYLGHPIVADPIYSGRKQSERDLTWCPRLFLHAASLELTHPKTGIRVNFGAQLPDDLAKARSRLVH